MTSRRTRGALQIAAAVLIVVGLAGAGYVRWAPEPEERFCTMGLAFTEVDGRTVNLQDQGGPGRDGCDHDEVPSPAGPSGVVGDDVLGFDCKVRDAEGTVVATTQPNRADGTCGKPDR